MNKMAEQDLQRLMQETNHLSLELSDVKRISQLVELADKVSNCDIVPARWRASFPIKCGSFTLEPMTIGKAIWFDEYAREWFKNDNSVVVTMVVGYIMSVSNALKDLVNINDKDTFIKLVLDYWRDADCSYDDIVDTVNLLVPRPATSLRLCKECGQSLSNSDNEVDYGPIIRLLVREYGGTATHWMYDVNIVEVENLLQSWIKEQADEYAKIKKNAHRTGTSLPTSPSLVQAVKNYRECLNSLRDLWQTKT